MAESTLDMIAAPAETSATLMIAGYTREDWQDSPAVDALRDAAMMLRDGRRDVPPALLEALTLAEAAGHVLLAAGRAGHGEDSDHKLQ